MSDHFCEVNGVTLRFKNQIYFCAFVKLFFALFMTFLNDAVAVFNSLT